MRQVLRIFLAALLATKLHLREEEQKVLVMSGMSAVFAGLFGTPLTATTVSRCFGVLPETAVLTATFDVTPVLVLQMIGLSVGIGILGILLCVIFHGAEHLAKKWFSNDWIRIAKNV